MSTVEIEKISEVHLRVSGSYEAEQEIKDFFTFKIPGHQFSPKFKARIWDGTKSLYNLHTKRLPAGHIVRLLDFLKQNDIDVRFVDNELHGSPTGFDEDITREGVEEFVKNLNLMGGGEPIIAHDYQIEAIYNSLKARRLTLISPTASGKSMILYCIIRWILNMDSTARIILCVPNVGLVNQMFSDFEDYSSANGWDVGTFAQKLFSGKPKELASQILITTWQSLKNVIPKTGGSKVLNTYDAVLVDESQSARGRELQSLLESMTMVPYRIGTTGTTTDPVNQLIIEGYLGPIFKVVTTKELMDSGRVSKMLIKSLVLSYSEGERKLVSQKTKAKDRMDYPTEIQFIDDHNKRNKFIRNLALACDGQTLILFNHLEHGKALCQLIKEKSTRPVYYVDGSVDGDIREDIRKLAATEDCVIVASFGTFSAGVNIKSIRNIIFAAPSKAAIRILQSIGRGLRLHKDKDRLNLFDIVDDLKWKSNKNFALQHFEERLKIYQSEQFEITVKELLL